MTTLKQANGRFVLFLSITFFLTFFSWGMMAILGLPGASTDPAAPPPNPGNLVLLLIGGFSPTIAGIITALVTGGRTALKDLFKRSVRFSFGVKYYAVIVLLPAFVLGIRLGLHALRSGEFLDSALLAQPLSFIGFTVQILFLGPVSEEYGWRGVALDPLLEKRGLVRASLVLGAIWAVWHLPLFFIPQTAQHAYGSPVAEFFIFAAGVIGMTVVFTWLYVGTNRSIASAILYHFTYNFALSFLATVMDGGIVDRMINSGIQVAAAAVIIIVYSSRNRASAGDA